MGCCGGKPSEPEPPQEEKKVEPEKVEKTVSPRPIKAFGKREEKQTKSPTPPAVAVRIDPQPTPDDENENTKQKMRALQTLKATDLATPIILVTPPASQNPSFPTEKLEKAIEAGEADKDDKDMVMIEKIPTDTDGDDLRRAVSWEDLHDEPEERGTIRYVQTTDTARKSELLFKANSSRKQHLEQQLDAHQADEKLSVKTLYDSFASIDKREDPDSKFMNKDNLYDALGQCGCFPRDLHPAIQERLLVFFGMDKKGNGTIDFFDFSANLSAFVSGSDEEATFLLFTLFDHDDDGNLSVEDLARLMLTEDYITGTVTGAAKNEHKLNEKRLMRRAKRLLKQGDTGVANNKISFIEFMEMRGFRDDRKLLLARQRTAASGSDASDFPATPVFYGGP